MGRFTVTVEETLMEDAMEAMGTRSKADTVRRALTEVLRRKRIAGALAHQGQIELDLDQDKLQELRAQR